ncbi:hypothetical protein BXZ70DRAFT_22503 [Cristinia sonorae]|uniref:RING-type E3 ubiquitin transferase n=1 Tax=Cristinia sonorae TaxID=1940300 RepID=A0A8K0XUQ2_9AGAR|nr:hypothetical protein BXZ70DRAFT_22503 [Cristinia sonorae]
MESHNVAFSPDEDHALRRVRSTGDIDASTSRPSRAYHSPGHHAPSRSDGHTQHPPGFPFSTLNRISPATSADELPPLRPPTPARSPPPATPSRRASAAAAGTRAGQRNGPQRHGVLGSILTLLGYQGPNAAARKEIIALVWNLSFALVQFVAVVTLLAISAHTESPIVPGISEWKACERPLGAWNCIWVVRVVLGAILAMWGFKRDRTIRLAAEQRQRETLDSLESGGRPRLSSPAALGGNTRSLPTDRTTYPRPDPTPVNTPSRANTTTNVTLPYSNLYSRLSLITSLMSLTWFLTAHVLEYTSTNTCRRTSPHLWWLTFGIICILYLMILEIFLLGVLVFILGPIIYVAWSLILLCLGRHPLQNPFYIKPEIGKLPKSVVDQIPLVLYIPAPPEDSAYHNSQSKGSPITVPQPVYSYPPKSPTASSTLPRKKRFAFLRRKDKKSKDGEKGSGKNKGSKGKGVPEAEKTWEDHWEAGSYPFVRLEGNRAACAICLMDFEEPKRVEGPHPLLSATEAQRQEPAEVPANEASGGETTEEVVRVDEITVEDRERLQLEDAGEGAQPLRLLVCGHVFHKTCLDPWLTDVSGRCPVCQRAVEIPEPPKKKRRGNSRTNSTPNS